MFALMDDEEIRELSQTMANLGTVSSTIIERLFVEFAEQISSTGSLVGTYESTERLLMKVLDTDKVNQIMEEIRGPAGRTMWDKLGNVNEAVLANYLKNEYPQTVAVVLSKIKAEHAARVLAALPEDFAHGMRHAHAAHGAGAEGDARQDRADAAHRVHVQPRAHRRARQPRDDGGNLQQLRPPDREPLHRPPWRSATARRPSASGADVHLRGPVQARSRRASRPCCARSRRTKLALALKGASETLRELFFTNM